MSFNKVQALELTKSSSSDSNIWRDMLIIGLVEFAKDALIVAATATMGPVGAIATKFLLDAGASMLEDYLTGNDPFEEDNLLTSVGFSAVGVFGKIANAKKWNKSYLRTLGKAKGATKEQEKILFHLNDELTSMKLTGGANDLRNYQKIVNKYEATGIFDTLKITRNEFEDQIKKDVLRREKFKRINLVIRKSNKFISMLNPDYAVKVVGDTIFEAKRFKAFKKKINEHIDKWWNSKFGRAIKKEGKLNREIYKTLIPLNHVDADWILGIRIAQMPGNPNLWTIRFIFNSDLTNNKQPVYVYNKTYAEILEILKASSAGNYYINNICWGWDIGRLIRQNKGSQLLTTSLMPYMSRSLSLVLSTIRTIEKAQKNIKNFSKNWNEFLNKKNLAKSVGLQIFESSIKGIHHIDLAKTTANFITSKGNIKYLRNYVRQKTRKYQKTKIEQWAFKKQGVIKF